MSIVLFGGGGGASSVPVATETVQGKAQIATSAQVTTGTEAGAYFVTPARLQSKIDAALTSTLEYKGSYNNTTASPDLTTATKGDLYIVDNAGGGTLAGVAISVGDHIVFNQNSASPLQASYFDVIVSSDAVQSVNGRVGVVTGLLDASNNLSDVVNAATARTNLGLGTAATSASTDFLTVANNLSDLNNAGTARTNLGLGTAATTASTDYLAVSNNLSDLNNAGTARTNLGLGTSAVIDVGTSANQVVQLDGSARLPAVDGSQLTNLPASSGVLLAANNLNDVASSSAARANLGVGTIATQNKTAIDITGGTIVGITDLVVADGGTGASNASDARTNLGVAIGSDVQAYDADLTAIASLSSADGNFIVGSASGWVAESGATARTSLGCIADVVEDTTPQLGGNLDVNGNDIVSVLNGNIDILPNGTGKVNLDGDGSASGVTVSDALIEMRSSTGSPAAIELYCESSNAHKVTVKAPAHSAFSGDVNFQLPATNGTAGQFLKTDGSGNTSWDTASGGGGASRPTVNTDASATINVSAPASSVLEVIYLCSATTGTQTVNLHASSGHAGLKYNIKRTGTVNVTIDPNASETIDGAATFVLSTQFDAVTLVSDGTNWAII